VIFNQMAIDAITLTGVGFELDINAEVGEI
jgi:hypothetical protein